VIAPLVVACNAILGVEDIADVGCHIKPQLGPITSSSLKATLSRIQAGVDYGSALTFEVNDSTTLYVNIYDRSSQSRMVVTTGEHMLMPEDKDDEACGICISAEVYVGMGPDSTSQMFQALPEGALYLETANNIGLAGNLQKLRLRHIAKHGGETVELDDGCVAAIDSIQFNMTYPPLPAP
jgi:hypothetical protein